MTDALPQVLSELLGSGDIEKIDDFMYCLLSLMSQGYDLSPFAGHIIRLTSIPCLPLKKIISSYFIRYSESINGVDILLTNYLIKDFDDPNPNVRRLAIKTVCSIPHLKDLSLEMLQNALKDSNSYVKHTAICSCTEIIDGSYSSYKIIDQLYDMIRDPDVLIASSCIASLNEILQHEGGIVINNKMFCHIFHKMSAFPDWNFGIICGILKNYISVNSDILLPENILSTSKFPPKFLPISELVFMLFKTNFNDLKNIIYKTVFHSFLSVLNTASSEMFWSIMRCMETCILKCGEEFKNQFRLFFCHFSEAHYLKFSKIKFLPSLINSQNRNQIIEELVYHCAESKDLAVQALYSLTEVLILSPEFVEFENLLEFMCVNNSVFIEHLMVCLNKIVVQNVETFKKSIIPIKILSCRSKINTIFGRRSLICILTLYGNTLNNAPYIIEELFSQNDSDHHQIILLLLTAAVKLYRYQPAEMQQLLGEMVWKLAQSQFFIIRSKALVFYKFVRKMKQIPAFKYI